MANGGGEIYSATYSNVGSASLFSTRQPADSHTQVPVYELKVGSDHVMRRRSDDWVNATHILKIAGFDKPARTRILEREVQKGVHEKIQGGYGKYQGREVRFSWNVRETHCEVRDVGTVVRGASSSREERGLGQNIESLRLRPRRSKSTSGAQTFHGRVKPAESSEGPGGSEKSAE